MSVPLDNLYNWVESLFSNPVVLYVFHPHGSKKISDCVFLTKYNGNTLWKSPGVIMHDQEPLDWDLYQDSAQYLDLWNHYEFDPNTTLSTVPLYRKLCFEYFCNFNLASVAFANLMVYDRVILVHSEKNSRDLAHYEQNGFVCVHYWAHAVIARDWYRFAEHDPRLDATITNQTTFLIYCRDWSHRREYRLKFLELLIKNQLHQHSLTSVMHVNSQNQHFADYEFLNPELTLDCPDLINQLPANTFNSTASADYEYQDFVQSKISVILETVFDDSRVHLTEKTLRSIACGHPFILAAGPRALEYIRSYGFKTFDPWIDESYDQEYNSLARLEKIIHAMKKIQSLSDSKQQEFDRAIKDIANYNKKHFFSKQFADMLQAELKDNLRKANVVVSQTQSRHWLTLSKEIKRQRIPFPKEIRRLRTQVARRLRQSCQGDRSNLPEDPAV